MAGALVMDSRGIYDAMTRNISSLHGLRDMQPSRLRADARRQPSAEGGHGAALGERLGSTW